MALITKESVYAACAAIVARDGKVSWNAVKAEHGGRGSPNDGLPHLKAWRADQATQLATAVPVVEAPVVSGEPAPPPALPEVTAALDALAHAISAAASRVQVEERRSSEARLNALAGLHAEGLAARDRMHAEAVAALGLRLSDAEADLDDVTPTLAEAEVLRDRVAEIEAEGVALGAELAAGAADLASVRAALDEAVQGRTVAMTAVAHAETEAREWKVQLGLAQGELANVRDAAAAAAVTALTALDAVRAELTAALGVDRAEASAAAKEASTALDSVRRELSEAGAAARYAAAAAAKEASMALDTVRYELSEAGVAARLAEQRLADAQAAEGRERAGKEKAEERSASLIERASRAEAELSLATRPSPVQLAAA